MTSAGQWLEALSARMNFDGGPRTLSKLLTWLNTDAMRGTVAYYMQFICLGLGAGIIGPTLPSLAEQTQTRVGQLGALFLAGAIGGTLGVVVGGRVLDRVRGNRVLGLAQGWSAVCMLLIPLLPSAWLLVAVLALKGVADGFINTGANTLLVWTHRDKSSPFMNALHFFFGLGAFLAPFIVAQVVIIPNGYRWAYWGVAVLSALVSVRLLSLNRHPQPLHAGHAVEIPARINYPLVLSAALFLFFYVGAEIAFGGWIYTYAFTLKLADAATAAYLTSGFWLTFTIGRLISIPLASRFTPQQMIGAALVGCLAVVLAALILPANSTLVWVLALTLGFCMAPVYPSGFTLAGRSLRLTARVSGIILLGDSFGGMILPWLVGQVLDVTGPAALIALVFTSLIFNGLAFLAMLRLQLKQPADAILSPSSAGQ
jgi:FHS family Na+ dependent glucose MFS transporter 1